MRRYVIIGCNQTGAGPEEVGRAQIPADAVAGALPGLKAELGAQELVYLATCHRTEFYLAYDGPLCPGRLLMALSSALPRLTGGTSSLPALEKCLAEHEQNASRHLFRVTAALDSLMPGDNQILGQVKGAFRLASDLGVAGSRLSALFTQAFRAAKRVRTETGLSRHPVSLLSLAERRLGRRLAAAAGPVAVVGAGSMAGLAVELVRKLDPARGIVVFNRGRDRGEALAARCGGTFRPLESLRASGDGFAAVITAASSPVPLIDPGLAALLAPTFLLDLGMPPNLAPGCGRADGIEHVDQVALRLEAETNRSARHAEIAQAEAIIEEQLRELAYEVMEVELSPVARHLVAAFRELARNEMTRMMDGGYDVPPERLDEAVDRLSQRLVRVPLRGLREVAWQHSPDVLSIFLAAVEK
jgi:glutamyl-tRNA reductase